jgi:Tol biopolymer transport system component
MPSGVSTAGTFFYALQVGLVDVYQASFDPNHTPVVEGVRPIAPAQVGSKITSGWSPDGRFVAYVALPHAGTGAADSRRLAILDVDSGASRLLEPRLAYYQFPRWSPDGRQILVKGTDLASRRGVHLIDPQTGATRPAAVVTAASPQEIGSVHWGPDSATILLARQNLGVLTLDVVTGVERLLFSYQNEGITTITPMPGLGLSRDGRTLAYSAYRKNAAGQDESVLRVMTIGKPGRDLLVGAFRFQDWTADGQVLLTDTGGDSQRASLWSISPAGGPPRALGFSMHGLRDVRVDTAGRQIVFTTGFPGSEVWALENLFQENEQ